MQAINFAHQQSPRFFFWPFARIGTFSPSPPPNNAHAALPTRVTGVMAEPANEASATVTVQQQQQNGSAGTAGSPAEAQQEAAPPVLTLRLRPRPSVTWGADVINNEGMGKKSSKRECGKEGGREGGGRKKKVVFFCQRCDSCS